MASIYAYATKSSYVQGEQAQFCVSSDWTGTIVATIWRFTSSGWAKVMSGGVPLTVIGSSPGVQPTPVDAAEKGCGWPVAPSFSVSLTDSVFPSGLYAVSWSYTSPADSNEVEHTEFIVRSATPGATSRVLCLWPFATVLAYSQGRFGANVQAWDVSASLYEVSPAETFRKRRRRVSANRPVRHSTGELFSYTGAAWPVLSPPGVTKVHVDDAPYGLRGPGSVFQFLDGVYHPESCTSLDLETGSLDLSQYNLIVLMGHDEYWSENMRGRLDGFRTSGGNILQCSGNTMWWRVRFEGAGAEPRMMVCTKNPIEDPTTSYFSSPPTSFTSDPAKPENYSIGASYRKGVSGPVGMQWTVQHADDWAFAGTGLAEGGSFPGCGFETDGVDLRACDGVSWNTSVTWGGSPGFRAVATGADGTPTHFKVLGYVNLLSGADHAGWGGVVGYYWTPYRPYFGGPATQFGTVFSFGSVDLGLSLSGASANATVQRIVRNVVEMLRLRLDAPPGSAPGYGATYPGPGSATEPVAAWQAIQAAPSDPAILAGATGFCGHIGGHLLLASGGHLYRRAPNYESYRVPDPPGWERIDPPAAVLPAGTTGLCAKAREGCPIYAFGPTSWRARVSLPSVGVTGRPPPGGDLTWSTAVLPEFPPVPASTIGLCWTDPTFFAIVGSASSPANNSLFGFLGSWVRLGDAQSIVAIADCDHKLLGLKSDGSVVYRDSASVDLTWMPLCGPAGSGVAKGIAHYLGRLYQLVKSTDGSSGAVWWRTATLDATNAPYRPGKLLFLDTSTGASGVGNISPFGEYEPKTSPAFGSGWTHVACGDPEWAIQPVNRASLLFYKQGTGEVATCRIDVAGNISTCYGGGILSGCTNLVRVALERFLAYRRSDGAGQVWGLDASGLLGSPLMNLSSGFAAWTHIATSSYGGVLFVNLETGAAYGAYWNPAGPGFPGSTAPSLPFTGVRGSIATAGNGLVVVYKRRSSPTATDGGNAAVYKVTGFGTATLLGELTGLGRDWTHVVGTAGGSLVFYANGSGQPGSPDAIPGTLRVVGIRATGTGVEAETLREYSGWFGDSWPIVTAI